MKSWLRRYRANPQAAFRLFCFPYAGGSAQVFRYGGIGMSGSVEVLPIQLPGHGDRLMEKPHASITELVEAVSQALMPYLDMPFALFGHSLGAIICYEIARYLRRNGGYTPVHLFAS